VERIKGDVIPFSLPSLGKEEMDEVADVLESGWITTGLKAKTFEQVVTGYVGSGYGVAVNSCTAALHLALDAIGTRSGDEVITTPMTFAASAEVIRYFRAKPVFIDVEDATLNIDASRIEEYLDKKRVSGKSRDRKVKAIIPVHYAGHPCDMDAIQAVAKKYGVSVIEDAAHAFPAVYRGRIIGSIGDITCFSFYATKNITTGEGGMAVTDRPEWADRMRIMSLHGISRDAWKRYASDGHWYYEILEAGFKYNLTDIAAAIGIVQMRKVDDFLQRRTEIANAYNEAFSKLPGVRIPLVRDYAAGQWVARQDLGGVDVGRRIGLGDRTIHSWHLYPVRVDEAVIPCSRNTVITELKSLGIQTSVHFIPLHIHPYYRKKYGYRETDYPNAFREYTKIISLPIYPRMTDLEVERVIESFSAVIRRNVR